MDTYKGYLKLDTKLNKYSRITSLLLLAYLCIYLSREGEKKRDRVGKGGAEGERESSVLSMLSLETDMGFDLTTLRS